MIEKFLKELVASGSIDVFVQSGLDIAAKTKSSMEWKKLFVETGQHFIDYENTADQFFDDLANVLSEKNMEALAAELKDELGYDLEQKLKNRILKMFDQYEISHDQAILYADNILTVIIDNLPHIAPEKYDRLYIQSVTQQSKANQLKTLEKMESMLKSINELKARDIEIYSAGQIDLELKRNTANPKIGISFFRIDDDSFIESFREKRFNECVFIKCRCREEGIYSVINELWQLNDERPIFIVKNERDWRQILNLNESGNIYIPWFFSDETPAIPDNTTIFVLSEDDPTFSKEILTLRPRTINTIIGSLQDAGMDSKDAYALVEDTHGLFIPIKKKIYNGYYDKKPNWISGLPERIIKTCLLVGKWTESDGDKAIIESLSRISYDAFIEQIKPYMHGEDPLIYCYKHRSGNLYALASAENTWEYVNIELNDPIWRQFTDLFIEVLNESEMLFTCSEQERMMAQFHGDTLFWSKAIRSGMIRTLIMKAFYKRDEECQGALDNLVKQILDYVSTPEQWKYISRFIVSLCEVSPKAVITRIKKELKESTGLLILFNNQTEDVIFGRNDYIDVLFAIESLLCQNMYASEGLELLLRLDNMPFSFKSNSPKHSLDKVFCTWANFSSFKSANQKLDACSKAFEYDQNAWDILYDALPKNNNSMVGELVYPKYRDHDILSSVTYSDMKDTVNGYIKLLIDNAEDKSDRLIKLFNVAFEYGDELSQSIINTIKDSLPHMTDLEIIDVKESIREAVYKNRFYSTASWALSEEKIAVCEELLDSIHTNEPEYEYRYLFKNDWNFPLTNPVPYDEEDRRDKNNEIARNLINQKIIEFKNNGYDLNKLIKICALQDYSTLGRYLAEEWGFDLTVFSSLLEIQKSGSMAVDYYRRCASDQSVSFPKLLKEAKRLGCSNDVITNLYYEEYRVSNGTPEIATADDVIKKQFWNRNGLRFEGNLEWAINECKRYGTAETYLEILHELIHESKICAEECYSYLMSLNELEYSPAKDHTMMEFHLKEILKVMQMHFLNDDNKRQGIANIELRFFYLLDWQDMRCFAYEIKRSPVIYAELIAQLYKKDNDTNNKDDSEENRNKIRNLYHFFDKAKFCPAEIDGEVSEESLCEWIEGLKHNLEQNDQASLFGMIVGRLLSFAPMGHDDYEPCESVRTAIEKYYDESLAREYELSKFNQRGMFCASAGREEYVIAERYKENAEFLSLQYPRTAEIYYNLYTRYRREAEQERREAEYVQF